MCDQRWAKQLAGWLARSLAWAPRSRTDLPVRIRERHDDRVHVTALDRPKVLSVFEAKLGSEHFNVGLVLNNLAAIDLERGNLELAGERYGRSLTILQAGLGEDHPVTAHPTMGIARVALAAGEGEALALAQRASTLLGTSADPQERAEVDFLLARALWIAPVDGGRDRKLALSLARGAEVAYATIDPEHRELVGVRRWLAGDRD